MTLHSQRRDCAFVGVEHGSDSTVSYFGAPGGVIVAGMLAIVTGLILSYWGLTFDDSYISYRYAANLADGCGLTWNCGEMPTEGYTNFLLILILAPLISLGADPLIATRSLNAVSVGAIIWLIGLCSRERGGAWKMTALVASCAMVVGTRVVELSLVGLETVLFSAVLAWTVYAGAQQLEKRTFSASVLFYTCSTACFLLRPESLLVVVAHSAVVVGRWRKSTYGEWLAVIGGAMLGLVLPLIVYAIWKVQHYGGLLPNPFYIKTGIEGLASRFGVASVTTFVSDFALFLFFVVLGTARSGACSFERQRTFVVLVITSYLLFFLRVDTLMDIYGRFLFPIGLLTVFLALRSFEKIGDLLSRLSAGRPMLGGVAIAAALLVLFMLPEGRGVGDLRGLYGKPGIYPGRVLMEREKELARSLASYPGIRSLHIAFGDAGVIPFFTGAKFTDLVGLNDSFIARSVDHKALVTYVFDREPDLILHAATPDNEWITFGHGRLGNLQSWSLDERWDRYEYVGSVRPGPKSYDLHAFVRRDSKHADELDSFLLSCVLDGKYRVFPIAIGTYRPPDALRPGWYASRSVVHGVELP
jgi:arabinofuranosyltransferase